jgi:hypothetical protein
MKHQTISILAEARPTVTTPMGKCTVLIIGSEVLAGLPVTRIVAMGPDLPHGIVDLSKDFPPDGVAIRQAWREGFAVNTAGDPVKQAIVVALLADPTIAKEVT